MSNTVISVNRLTKTYPLYARKRDRLIEALSLTRKTYHEKFYALNNVSFNVKKGECIGIIGQNGSGKSTLLKILTGVLTPSDGSIDIKGRVSALLELGAGFNMEYTGIENIYLNGAIMGIERKEMEKRIDGILDFAGIGNFVHHPVKMYSSGMFVRLAFAVAINVDPDILIVDEALSVGDLNFQLKCMDKFNYFRDQGKTIVFVTHDINSVKRYCTRTIWLKDGEIKKEGDTNKVTDDYLDHLKLSADMPEAQSKQDDKNINSSSLNSPNDICNILSTKLLDNNHAIIKEANYGDDIILKIDFEMKRDDIKNIVIGAAIRTIDHKYVCGLNTLLDKINIPYEKGVNTIYLKYNKLNLLGGSYYFDVAVFEKNAHVSLDYKSKICNFFVNSPYSGEGVCILNHEWQLDTKKGESYEV